MAAKRYALVPFGHFWRLYAAYGHTDQWVRLPAWGFLLEFNDSAKMHRFELGAWDRQTDGQTDGSQHWLTPLPAGGA